LAREEPRKPAAPVIKKFMMVIILLVFGKNKITSAGDVLKVSKTLLFSFRQPTNFE
jgi:hypothetical protein